MKVNDNKKHYLLVDAAPHLDTEQCAHREDTHLAEKQLVKHLHNEESPVDVEQEQDGQHDIEEVVAEKGSEILHRIHPGAVNHPAEIPRNSHLSR